MRLLRAGRALLVRDAAMGTHLWFAVTDPDPHAMVLVMLVSSDMSPALLGRVRAGLLASARTPNEIADYCRAKFSP